ncbi:MAG: hypothetical protein J5626_07100 [Lachnospiraceae bacterium]|nr:hypothetical protein [Lachnospiraceae bacterium]
MKRFGRLTGVFAIVGILFTVLVPHGVSFADGSRDVTPTRNIWWETKFFPIQPRTDEWKQYSVAEIYEIMNPPEEMMDYFSTKELAELMAQWHDANGFDYLYMYFDALEEKSLIFRTLLERPDGIHWMLKTYEACNTAVENGEISYRPMFGEDGYDWHEDDWAEQFFIEFIDLYFYTFSDDDVALYNTVIEEKQARYELLSEERSTWLRKRLYKDGKELTAEERETTVYGSYTEKSCELYWRNYRDYPFAAGMVPAGYRMFNLRTDLMPGDPPPAMVTNPPEDILNSFSTSELAELALKYPWVAAMDLTAKDIDSFFDKAEQEYTIYQELSAKEDAVVYILDEYEKNRLYSYDVPNLTMEMIQSGNRYLLEELFACRYIDRYKDRLTDADIERYLKIYKEKAETYDYIKDPAVRELFETELSLAEYGFSAEAYRPKDSGDFVIADIEPVIVEEPAPAAPKEWVPRQSETESEEEVAHEPAEVIDPSPVGVSPEGEPAEKHNSFFVTGAVIVAVLMVVCVTAYAIAGRNKRRSE